MDAIFGYNDQPKQWSVCFGWIFGPFFCSFFWWDVFFPRDLLFLLAGILLADGFFENTPLPQFTTLKKLVAWKTQKGQASRWNHIESSRRCTLKGGNLLFVSRPVCGCDDNCCVQPFFFQTFSPFFWFLVSWLRLKRLIYLIFGRKKHTQVFKKTQWF